MYNKAKVIAGIIVFIGIVTVPLWNRAVSSPASLPELKLPQGVSCVEDREYMRTSHMDLLNKWRNEAVRKNDKIYVNKKGEHFNKSLTGTCLNCHESKEEFCDSCHEAAGVKPYCFDCHVTGREGQAGEQGEEK